MKRLGMAIALAASLAVSAPVLAHADSGLQASDSIFVGSFGRINSWRPVSRDELIVWASPSRPYLIKIWRPTSSLRFAHAIGITSTAGRVTRFDKVIVDGWRYPIESIVAIDRDTAKSMHWKKRQST